MPARGELEATATYERRSWQWLPAEPGDHADGRDGTLVILLTTVGKRSARTTFHYYGVQVEWDQAVEFGLRSFLLENEREPDADGPIRCVVGGMAETCTCEAGCVDRARQVERQTDCKHRAALRAMCEQGVFGC